MKFKLFLTVYMYIATIVATYTYYKWSISYYKSLTNKTITIDNKSLLKDTICNETLYKHRLDSVLSIKQKVLHDTLYVIKDTTYFKRK